MAGNKPIGLGAELTSESNLLCEGVGKMQDRLMQQMAGLSPEKRALLKLRLLQKDYPSKVQVIPRRAKTGPCPLSFPQELLWLVDQLTPNSVIYSVPRAMRMIGEVNVKALQQTLDTILARHEVLRTTIQTAQNGPVQVVRENQRVDLCVMDLSSHPTPDKEVQRLLSQLTSKPFDVSRDILLRATLLRLAPSEHVFLLETHHIASDGWSKAVLFKEMAALYQAFSEGKSSPLADLPIQYADFAMWQREMMQGEVFQKQLAYWKEQLADAPTLLECPGAHPRPPIQSYKGRFQRFDMPMALLEGFKALSRQERTTLFITLLAAFKAFLYRWTNQTDLVVGTPVAGRNCSEVQELIGYFTNTLALRTDLSGNPTFRELVQRVRQMALSAYENQDLPFEKLVIELQPERTLRHAPIFQILFSVGHWAAQVPDLSGLTLTPLVIDRGIAKFDLTLGFTEMANGLGVGCEYSTDLFDEITLTRMIGNLRVLMEGILINPDQRLSDLPLLTASERHQLLIDWNATDQNFPHEACFHQLFEAQVAQTPQAPAALFCDQQLTYQELNDRANQLARFLQKLGVGPEILVGIAVESSLEAAVGLLGVLKAGGAFLPVDPAYPQERLTFIVQDSRASIVLTQKHLAEQIGATGAKILCLDADWEKIAQESPEEVLNDVRPGNLAYVIYTSGSTGRPKGVLVTQRGLVNHNLAVSKEYGLRPEDRVMQFSSLSFDIAVEEIFPAWASGAAVVFRPPDLGLGGVEFLRWLDQEQITVLDLPTAFWHEWVHELVSLKTVLPTSLRLVVVGGEKALAEAYFTWRQVGGSRVRWLNTYGPTEATVIATLYEPEDTHQPKDNGEDIPIGWPIANTRIYLLDAHLQMVPIGVPGEMYIGGAGVARGYLNHPDLTAEKFLPDPFNADPGARLYRTGDLARWRADGLLEFVGRIDSQVKIRGFRIELGEIETRLSRHPEVREALVIVREDLPGAKRLVAYVVPKEGKDLDPSDLRRFSNEMLPAYMVPSAFVIMGVLPLTSNGKIDRNSLPRPDLIDAAIGTEYAAPQTTVEAALGEIWEKVLGLEGIGIHDNFFELGGHSLLATQVMSLILETFQVQVSLRHFFQAPTLAELAVVVVQQAKLLQDPAHRRGGTEVIPIQPRGNKTPLFFLPALAGEVVYCQKIAKYLDPDQPVFGIVNPWNSLEPLQEQTSFEAVATRYVENLCNFQPKGPYCLAGYCFAGKVAYEVARQLAVKGHQVKLLAIIDTDPSRPTDKSISSIVTTGIGWLLNIPFFFIDDLMWERPQNLVTRIGLLRQKIRARWNRLQRSGTGTRKISRIDRLFDTRGLPDQLRRFMEGNLDALKEYTFAPYPGRITLFRSRRRALLSMGQTKSSWEPLAKGGVDIRTVPGHHSNMLREPFVRILAKKLQTALTQAE